MNANIYAYELFEDDGMVNIEKQFNREYIRYTGFQMR